MDMGAEPLWAQVPRRLLAISSSTETENNLTPGQTAIYACVCAFCVIGSGLAAGLTLGLMSLDKVEMQVLLRSGTNKEKKLAKSILPVLADPHWLLVTLLLCNAACFEALPIFLDVLVAPITAILISVTLILVFGEILPQAVCARHGLTIGAYVAWPVRILMWVLSPISWPLARALDWLLGKEGYNMFKRNQLKALVDLHGADEGLGGKLSDDEVQIICGALDLTNKVAYSAMTPLEKVVMLSTEQFIDATTVATILSSGHSRLPVYAGKEKSNIVGLLLVKELLQHCFPKPETGVFETVQVSSLTLRHIPRLAANTRMYDMLRLFQTGRAHMVLLTQPEVVEEEARPSAPTLPNPAANDEIQPPPAIKTAGAVEIQMSSASAHERSTPTAATPSFFSSLKLRGSRKRSSEGQGDGDGSPDATHHRVSGAGSGPLTRLSHTMSHKLGLQRSSSTSSSSSSSGSSEDIQVVEVPQIAHPGEPIGIITIEDVIEELMGQEILDETDAYADNECTQVVDEEMRAQLAARLPDGLRNLVLGSASASTIRRLSRARANSSGNLVRTSGSQHGGAQQVVEPALADPAGVVVSAVQVTKPPAAAP